ncbi:NADH-cytochrome b5 reductase 2 [Limtongia smithiae]|uniref:NADH-cytochrome b5 reductase 2 n=1 Tax=Limtongia smithiae TaxID=1125753 RepID=UPI0034CD9167
MQSQSLFRAGRVFANKSFSRLYSSSASSTSMSSFRRPLIVASSVAAAAALSYQFYTTMSKPISASSAVLTGDGEFVDLTLTGVEKVSENTSEFTFAFDDKSASSGLITASAVLIKYLTAKGNAVIRPYTPISDTEDKGALVLLVKEYPEGKASKHIHEMKIGEKLAFKGPIVKYAWSANKHPEIVLVGGGTGITPLYQLIHEINKNPADKTKVTLVYGNVTEEDILLKAQLDKIAAAKPEQFKFVYALDKPPAGWTGVTGFVTKEVLKGLLPPPTAENIKIFVCGPPGLCNAISGNKISPADQGELTGFLNELGYVKEQVFKF